ncbi:MULTISPECIES: hypothetical protein [unclassified Streptomyces]|uniref:hypothetical protein n=1 Tax=unclassified Streptomyces TaxID=2593676 RepID=UPI002E7FDF9D|nr:hypothetical protein [Streptomyces sp. NBC_00589]WTI41908.1 hypothetical protein OIC96_46485 [Streptomyces sp. NBC_00775]WUB24409.1 hypothetical protein OHA51_03235 [Streptomyces sp. NBC_00589]
MQQPEDELLAEALGRINRGGKIASRFLKNDIGEFDRELPLGFDLALERVRAVLAELSPGANPELVEAATDRVTLRVLTGGGALNMNPVVVTVDATRGGERTTTLHVRAIAKEGLIKQRAGQKAVERISALLN